MCHVRQHKAVSIQSLIRFQSLSTSRRVVSFFLPALNAVHSPLQRNEKQEDIKSDVSMITFGLKAFLKESLMMLNEDETACLTNRLILMSFNSP